MKINVLKETKDTMVFEIPGEQHTFPQLLCWALLQNPKVEVAVYNKEHPLIGDTKVYIKCKGITPKKALLGALDIIDKELASLKRGIQKIEAKKK
ncbi:MAG: DNA-directed RNA polymerase subunit L [Candidatus Diapherotrites archaeon]|nr:DNA-directed RNA polymerase subunit L [Candidatus Diapherotrites archaeon]